MRIDADRGTHDDVAEVERAGDRRDHDGETERGALVGTREEYLPALHVERVGACSRGDSCMPDQAIRSARALIGLRFGALFDALEDPQHALWQLDRYPAQSLVLVAAGERRGERAEPTRLVARGTRAERGVEPTTTTTVDLEAIRACRGGTGVRGRPRRQHRGRGVRPTPLRCRQRRTRATEEVELQVTEREL